MSNADCVFSFFESPTVPSIRPLIGPLDAPGVSFSNASHQHFVLQRAFLVKIKDGFLEVTSVLQMVSIECITYSVRCYTRKKFVFVLQ